MKLLQQQCCDDNNRNLIIRTTIEKQNKDSIIIIMSDSSERTLSVKEILALWNTKANDSNNKEETKFENKNTSVIGSNVKDIITALNTPASTSSTPSNSATKSRHPLISSLSNEEPTTTDVKCDSEANLSMIVPEDTNSIHIEKLCDGLPLSREFDTSHCDPIELHHDTVVEHDDSSNDNDKEDHPLIKELHELSADSSKAIDFGLLNSKVEYDDDNHEEQQQQYDDNHEEEQQQHDSNHEEGQQQHDDNHEEEQQQHDDNHEEEQKQHDSNQEGEQIPDSHIDEIIEIPTAPSLKSSLEQIKQSSLDCNIIQLEDNLVNTSDTPELKSKPENKLWDTAADGISATLASKLSMTSDGLQSKYSNLLEKHLLSVGKIEVIPKPSTANGQFESKYCHLLEKHLLTLERIDTSPASHESKQDRLFKSLSKEVINLEAKIRGKVTAN